MAESSANPNEQTRGKPLGDSIIGVVQQERMQSHETRLHLFEKLEDLLGRPVVTYFTSFAYPVSISDEDVDILEGILRTANLEHGLALMLSSPGGSGLAAERIVNMCRQYSGTGEFWTIVPSKAKSAATMVCFGSSEILMGPGSELGPVDPQWIVADENGRRRQFSIYNYVRSYEKLFKKAVEAKGNLQPFLQQLNRYDEREIEEFRSQLELTDDYAVRTLKTGMMKDLNEDEIRQKVQPFLEPSRKKVHGRPIFRDEASDCGLNVRGVDECDAVWSMVYELYVRTSQVVSGRALKCIESLEDSFSVPAPLEWQS